MKKTLLLIAAIGCTLALNAGLVSIGYMAPTDQNANDLLKGSNFTYTGKASYDKNTSTLTLNNCVVDSNATWTFSIVGRDTLTINLVGTSSIKNAYFSRYSYVGGNMLLKFTGSGSLYVDYVGVPMQANQTNLYMGADVTFRSWGANCACSVDTIIMKGAWLETPTNGYFKSFYTGIKKTVWQEDGTQAKLVHFAKDNSPLRGLEIEGFMLTQNQNYNPWQPKIVYVDSLQGVVVNSSTLTAKNNYSGITNYDSDVLNVYLNTNTNSVLWNGGGSSIESQNAAVNIYGPGSLTIYNGNGGGAAIYLDDNDLTIAQDATVNIICEGSDDFGVSLAGGALTVDHASLTVQGTPSLMGVDTLYVKHGVRILSDGHTFSGAKQSIIDATGEATNEQVIIARQDPTGMLEDIEGNLYPIVTIGDQTWMAENLRATVYDTESEKYGDTIQVLKKNSDWIYYLDAAKKTKWNNQSYKTNHITYDEMVKYGYFYSFGAALGMDSTQVRNDTTIDGYRQGICPNGWHLPTTAELQTLRNYIETTTHVYQTGKKLKATHGWYNNGNGTNEYGFELLPTGSTDRWVINQTGEAASFWLATSTNVEKGDRANAWNNTVTFAIEDLWRQYGACVRCLKDSSTPTNVEQVTGGRWQVTDGKKVLRNGQLLILIDGKTYNAQGQKL